jgi:hypothetical protein
MIGAVYLDWGHLGQPPRQNAPGGQFDDLIEAVEIGAYLSAIVRACYRRHIFVMVDGFGVYESRQARAVQFAKGYPGRVVYGACHLNIFPGEIRQRVGFFYDARSSGGARVAAAMAAAFYDAPYANVKRAIPCSPDDWTKNALYCIRGIYDGPANIAGCTLEPVGLNGTPKPTPDMLADVGERIADGLAAYFGS